MTVAKDLQKIVQDFEKKLDKNLTNQDAERLGKLAIEIIVKRTRRGFGVKQSGGNVRPLDSLSSQYIKFRERNASKLSRFTSPAKSNLTFTGQMLSSIKVLRVRRAKGLLSFTIGPNPNRRTDGKTNEDVAAFVSLQRPFFNLGRKELREVIETFEKRLKSRLK